MPLSEKERLRKIERQIERMRLWSGTAGGGAGNGRPYATKVVAASDSNATDAANADYVCDGVDDHVQINAALAVLSGGGRVLLLDGTFTLGGPVTLVSNCEVAGMGMYATRLTATGSVRLLDGQSVTGVVVRDLALAGTYIGVWLQTSADARVEGCRFDGLETGVYLTTPDRIEITNCLFEGGGIMVV